MKEIDYNALFYDSECLRKNYEIYRSNYEFWERKTYNRDIAVTRINKRLYTVETKCNSYYSGYIDVKSINLINKKFSTNLINLKWKNIMIPFVFLNHSECDK